MSDWYQKTAEEVIATLQSDAAQGLDAAEVGRRLKKYGRNELIERGIKSPWIILWEQLTEIMVVILIVAARFRFFCRSGPMLWSSWPLSSSMPSWA